MPQTPGELLNLVASAHQQELQSCALAHKPAAAAADDFGAWSPGVTYAVAAGEPLSL